MGIRQAQPVRKQILETSHEVGVQDRKLAACGLTAEVDSLGLLKQAALVMSYDVRRSSDK